MKKSVLKVSDFQVIETVTRSGKKAYCLVTKKRLSVEDFKSLMQDIRTAEGFGYNAYREGHGRCIHAVKIDAETLTALAKQYTWNTPEPKAEKVTKKVAKKVAKETALTDIVKSGINKEQLTALLALFGK